MPETITTEDTTMTEQTPQDAQNGPQDDAQTIDAPEGTEQPEAPQNDAQAPEDDTEPRSAEAKRYRLKLRESEQQRDQLAALVDTMRRAEIARIAIEDHVPAAALWAHHGDDITALLAEDGTIDLAAVRKAVQSTRQEFAIRPKLVAPRAEGVQGNTGGPVTGGTRERDFTDAFKPRR